MKDEISINELNALSACCSHFSQAKSGMVVAIFSTASDDDNEVDCLAVNEVIREGQSRYKVTWVFAGMNDPSGGVDVPHHAHDPRLTPLLYLINGVNEEELVMQTLLDALALAGRIADAVAEIILEDEDETELLYLHPGLAYPNAVALYGERAKRPIDMHPTIKQESLSGHGPFVLYPAVELGGYFGYDGPTIVSASMLADGAPERDHNGRIVLVEVDRFRGDPEDIAAIKTFLVIRIFHDLVLRLIKCDETTDSEEFNEALADLQAVIGVDDGGFAGMVFCDVVWERLTGSERRETLRKYIFSEFRNRE